MRYNQERKASEECLRLLIGKMALHPASFTPHNYAVWYEYLTGINESLTLELDHLFHEQMPLDDEVIYQLYENHISECSRDSSRIHEEIKNLVSEIMDISSDAGTQTVSFGNNLRDYGVQLKSKHDPIQLENLMSKMSRDAEVMHSSMTHLHDELERSQLEIGKLREELDTARLEAVVDPLTGIYNRRGFERELERITREQKIRRDRAYLLMIDIDHFKKVNDTYGHLFGDKVIVTLANNLKSRLAETGHDLVARFGGEEFAIFLSDSTLHRVNEIAEQIRANMETARIRNSNAIMNDAQITISVGIARFLQDKTLSECLELADKALYASKENGRNKVTSFV